MSKVFIVSKERIRMRDIKVRLTGFLLSFSIICSFLAAFWEKRTIFCFSVFLGALFLLFLYRFREEPEFQGDSCFFPFIYPLILVSFIFGISQMKEFEIFYIASLIGLVIVGFLFVRFRRKILIISFICVLSFLLLYDVSIGLKPYNWIETSGEALNYWKNMENYPRQFRVVFLSICLGFLASFITIMGSISSNTKLQRDDVKYILTSSAFLSFIITIVLLNISGIESGNGVASAIEREKEGARLMRYILPFGSCIVPVLSYFHGKFYSTQKDSQRKSLSLLFSGLVLSFSLGFIFGILSFGIPAAIDDRFHPVYYPFMLSSWMVVASYIHILDSEIWNLGYFLYRVRTFGNRFPNKYFYLACLAIIIVMVVLLLF